MGLAGKSTDDTSKKVMDLLSHVDSIVTALENSPNIDDNEIKRLEEEIRKTEEQLKEMKLEEKLKQLQDEHTSQSTLITQYRDDIAHLQADVDNIEQIVRSLPEGCFKRVVLEP